MSSDAEILPPQAGAQAGASTGAYGVRPGPGTFVAAAEHALWFQVGAFAVAAVLMLALPARRGHNAGPASV